MITFILLNELETLIDKIELEDSHPDITLTEQFQYGCVSFNHPEDWVIWEKDSFERISSFMKSRRKMRHVVYK